MSTGRIRGTLDRVRRVGELDGKVALVTGAAGGIGRAVAELLDARGATVVASDVRPLAGPGRSAVADISSESDVVALVDYTVAECGGLDILANVAAVTGAGLVDDRDVVTTPLDVWDRVMAVNLRGTMLLCRQAIPVMVERGGGAIVNVSSAAAVRGGTSLCAYSASKAALNNLTLHIARAFGRQGIRCNAVMPGTVEGTGAMSHPMLSEKHLSASKRMTSLGRLGRPDDIARMVAFLVTDVESGFVNGQVIACDGGL